MKTLYELIDGVRNADRYAGKNCTGVPQKSDPDCSRCRGYNEGHRAACDRLIPVVKQAMEYLEQCSLGASPAYANIGLEKLREILGHPERCICDSCNLVTAEGRGERATR